MAGKSKALEDENPLSVEETFREIEERIGVLERPDATLEEAFEAYRDGMRLIKECSQSISRIEKKVKEISEDGTLKDFEEVRR